MPDLDIEPRNARGFLRAVILELVGSMPNVQLQRSWSYMQANRDTLVTLYGGSEPEAERDVFGSKRGPETAEQVFAVSGVMRTETDTSEGPVSIVAAEQDQFIEDVRLALQSYQGSDGFSGEGYWLDIESIELRSFMADIDEDGSKGYASVVGVLTYTQTWG